MSGTIISVTGPEGSGRRLQGAVCQAAPQGADRGFVESPQRAAFLSIWLLFVYWFLFSYFLFDLLLKIQLIGGHHSLWPLGLQISILYTTRVPGCSLYFCWPL